MENIRVHRYSDAMASTSGWAGYVQPDEGDWVLFIGTDGGLALFDGATDRVVVAL